MLRILKNIASFTICGGGDINPKIENFLKVPILLTRFEKSIRKILREGWNIRRSSILSHSSVEKTTC